MPLHHSTFRMRWIHQEIRSHQAEPGDVLVVVDDISVEMTHPFGGAQRTFRWRRKNKAPQIRQVLGSQRCLQHARSAELASMQQHLWTPSNKGEEPGVEGGATDWQLLLHFEAEPENLGRETAPMGPTLGGQSLQKGDFSDT